MTLTHIAYEEAILLKEDILKHLNPKNITS